MKWRRRLRYPLSTAFIRLGRHLVVRLPHPLIAGLARLFGWLLLLIPRARRVGLANLAVAFPEWSAKRRRQTCRQAAYHTCLTGLEALWLAGRPERLDKLVTCGSPAAAKLMQQLAGQGQPLVILTPHLGNWEASGQFACRRGARLAAVARHFHNPGIGRLINQMRTAGGMEIIDHKGAVKNTVKAIRQGKSIGVLMDQNVRLRKGGVFVDFFGLPVPTSRAPAFLCLKLGIEAAGAAAIRRGNHLEIQVKKLPKPVAEYADERELTQALLALNEAFVRDHPEQYMWFYERWRYVPADLAPARRPQYPFYAKTTSEASEPLAAPVPPATPDNQP